MNITVLINQTRYSYHKEVAECIADFLKLRDHMVSIIDVCGLPFPHQNLSAVEQSSPDVLVILDLSGFHFLTQSGENALNMLYTKNLNLLWGNKPEYATFLSKKISLSMRFYDVSGTDTKLPDSFPNMLYFTACDQFFTAPAHIHQPDNTQLLEQIWNDFLEKTLLD